jgi:signal transduction histidine kinase
VAFFQLWLPPRVVEMKKLQMAKLRLVLGAAIAVGVLGALLVWGRTKPERHTPLPYLYEDTRQLVQCVEDAARLVEKRGSQAFHDFSVPGSRWFNDKNYLFIYDINGVCLFHPAMPELVGRNLLDLKDMNGKPVGQYINDIGRRPAPNASGWVFYLWEDRANLTPTWKMSYIRKAVGPDGKVYLVGSGIQTFKIETVFVKRMVDRAVELLKSQGKEIAFAHFRDRASPFFFCNTYVYVFNDKGRCLVDPGFPNLEMRDLTSFRDALGHYVVKEMLQRLQKSDTAWLQYMVPRPGTTMPARKLAYFRKVVVNGQTLIVGADFFLASPIWMKM